MMYVCASTPSTTHDHFAHYVFPVHCTAFTWHQVVLGMYAPDQSFGLLQIVRLALWRGQTSSSHPLQMFAFQRVTLEPGEGTVVTLFLTAKQLKDAHAEAGHERSHQQCGRGAVRINGDALVLPVVTDCHRLDA